MVRIINFKIKYLYTCRDRILFFLIVCVLIIDIQSAYAQSIPSYPDWIKLINLDKVWLHTKGDLGIKIAVIDTGVNSEEPCLKDKIVYKYNVLYNDGDVSDESGHGTWVASICAGNHDEERQIYGVCPHVSLIIIKVTDRENKCTPVNLAKGIQYSVDHGAKIINVSLGTYEYSYIIEKAINYAYEKGCIVVACTGNNDRNDIQYPAGLSGVVSVGACDNNNKAFFSNYGTQLKVLAPGMFIRGAKKNNDFREEIGTSASAPIVTGIIALLLSEYPSLNNQEIIKSICYSSFDIVKGNYNYNKGKDIYSGYGIVNAHKALNLSRIYTSSNMIRESYTVTNSDWFREAMSFCQTNNLVSNTNIMPNDLITQNECSEVIKRLKRHLNMDKEDNNLGYIDAKYLKRVEALRLVLDGMGIKVSDNNVISNIFEDFNFTPEIYKKYLTYSYQCGIIDGTTANRFEPSKYITYAEFMQIVYNYYFYYLSNEA